MAAIISVTERNTTNSGRTFMPWVSSSKKRSRPALAAGMGACFSRLFFLRLVLILSNQTFEISTRIGSVLAN